MDNDVLEYNEQNGVFGDELSEHEIEGEQASKKRKTPNRSSVWDHLTRVNYEKATCNYCKKEFAAGSSKGTSHLKRHLDSCKLKPKVNSVSPLQIAHDGQLTAKKVDQQVWRERSLDSCKLNPKVSGVSPLLIGDDGKMIAKKFDQQVWREKLVKMIIRHELPFSFVEFEAFREMIRYLNPDIKMICGNTIASDVCKLYEVEKEKLKIKFANVRSRICLTSDLWTTITHEGYICLTGHYVNEDWKLDSKMLLFCSMPPPHTGMEIAKKIYSCLKDWGIERKIFSLTTDNTTSNNSMHDILKHQLCLQNSLLCKGEFFHVGCSAHILDSIVQDGLKVIDEVLDKIRESVKYVRASEKRMQSLEECVDQVGREAGTSLSLDVATHWNSTYTMLDNALKYRYAFSNLQLMDMNYKYCPTNEEWSRGEKICDFLKPFDEITTLISGTNYPTSNLYFMKLWKIKMLLNSNGNSEEALIKSMALTVKVEFEKYWDQYSFILAMGAVLDPRMKFKALKYCFDQIDKNTSQANVDKVKTKLYMIFEEYKNTFVVGTSKDTMVSHVQCSKETGQSSTHFADLYGCDEEEYSDYGSESALDKYLNDPKLNMQRFEDMDILEFWKVNTPRYGTELASMASDILSIPITTAASESSFSAGSRLLNKYRSRLLPSSVQALLCVRSWLYGFTVDDSEGGGADNFLASSLPSMVIPESTNMR